MTAPSRKWLAARVTACTGLALLIVQDGGWHTAESIMAITLVSAAALSYLIPNDTQGGD